jgi:enamine deaminase RidA (YjgF/YER057c/UK114 family)
VERRVVNPWTWQDNFSFVQANEVSGQQQTLICSGQTSVDENGTPVHEGDMAAQISKALDNVEAVLAGASMTLANVVRLNIYTTDVDGFLANYGVVAQRLAQSGCKQASTLLGVQRLAFPPLMVELEAIAMS